MSDQNGKPVASPDDITEYFKTKFVFTDNVPEDMNRRREIVMEARASILIDAHCTSGRFPTFMKAGRHIESAWVFVLPQPFVYKTTIPVPHERDIIIEWAFREFVVYSDSILKPDDYGQTSRWRLFVNEYPTTHITNGITFNGTPQQQKSAVRNDIIEIQKAFANAYSSLWRLCKDITPYNTPEKACRFWGNAPFPFARLNLNKSVLRPDIFHKQANMTTEQLARLRQNHECTEVALFQLLLNDIVLNSSSDCFILPAYGNRYENWLKMVYTFKNEYGEPIMKVAKLYDKESQTKSLIPMTMWMRNNSTTDQLFCVPLPEEKQPLYNLDQLKADELSPVILADSIELADANEMEGVIFTSFICDPGQYDQVDWSPLLNRTVYYLVTNHSGSLLESAYLKAKEFAEYWEEKNKEEEENNLKFIQMEVDYPEKRRDYATLDDILTHYRDRKPTVTAESVEIFEDDQSFEIQYQKAVKVLDQKPSRWWDRESKNSEEQRVAENESNRRKPVNYVLRPFLIKGEVSMLYASKSTGKSALGISMAAAVVSGNPLLREKWWVVPKNPDYPLNKVLYLDFENGKTEIEIRKTQFAYPYWPQNKEARSKCEENLIVEDKTLDTVEKVDYSDRGNWPKIIAIIEAAKEKGTPGQPVDLLVIDTLSKFARKSYTADLSLSDFINNMRQMNIAILFLHHEGSNGQVRGWKCTLDDFYFTLRMYRKDENENHTLEDPLWLDYKPSRSGVEKTSPFEVKFDKKWAVHYEESDSDKSKPEEQRRKEELKRISDFYIKRGFQHQDIFPMLGIGKETYNNLKNR